MALDLPLHQAEAVYDSVSESIGYVKIGPSLFIEQGPAVVDSFRRRGAKVFLDLKLHDIPNTVRLASQRAAELGVSLLTVHAQGGASMLRAALEGVLKGATRGAGPKVLAVTILTSLDSSQLASLGYGESVEALVSRLAGIAHSSGLDGMVCSPHEAGVIRKALGDRPFLCTPGIRPAGTAREDQLRPDTPSKAIGAGANLLVIGRPIYEAKDSAAVARSLYAEVASALANRPAR